MKPGILMTLSCLTFVAGASGTNGESTAGADDPVGGQFTMLDVQHDLARMGIVENNVDGRGRTDDTAALQAAIDHVHESGGGVVIVPPGLYRISRLVVKPEVEVVGGGIDRTLFRAWNNEDMFVMRGGALRNFTAYGTPDAASSGDHWIIGTGGVGKGGTAIARHVITVRNGRNVLIDNVHAYEARYDCLYIRGVDGLRVTNCTFDRAGRNITSLVGNDRNFIFSDCHFGSYWGLYHVDIEPSRGRYVRDGMFLRCTFDGRRAGEKGTDTWGSMLILSGHRELKNRNVAIIDCTFHHIRIRSRGIFKDVKLLYNRHLDGNGPFFVKVRANPVGELRDTTVRGNRFILRDGATLNYEVTFTGNSVFEDNDPPDLDTRAPDGPARNGDWHEDHPTILETDRRLEGVEPEGNGVYRVRMPLAGHEFRFADRKISGLNPPELMDVAFHSDPLIGVGAARLKKLGTGRLEDYPEPPGRDDGYVKDLFGFRPNDVIAVRTNDSRLAIMQVVELASDSIVFRYRLLEANDSP